MFYTVIRSDSQTHFRAASLSMSALATSATEHRPAQGFIALYLHLAEAPGAGYEAVCEQSLWSIDNAEQIGLALIRAAHEARIEEGTKNREAQAAAVSDLEDDLVDDISRAVS